MPIYVFRPDAIHKAIGALTARPIHEHFAGYLALLRARRLLRSEQIPPREITGFHDRFLRGSNPRRPYLSVFRSRTYGTLSNMNANMAGSYAPSSLRGEKPFSKLITVEGQRQNAVYSLVGDHEQRVLTSMLGSQPAPLCALAAFLFREFGFDIERQDITLVLETAISELGLTDSLSNLPVTMFNDASSFSPDDLVPL